MRALQAYQQQDTPNWSRIDMLIAAFDGVTSRLKKAGEHLKKNEELKAQVLLIRAQRIICELYAGLNLEQGEIPKKMKSIYLFVLERIGLGDKLDLEAAISAMSTIRSGFLDIRDEAVRLERSGAWHTVDREPTTLVAAVG